MTIVLDSACLRQGSSMPYSRAELGKLFEPQRLVAKQQILSATPALFKQSCMCTANPVRQSEAATHNLKPRWFGPVPVHFGVRTATGGVTLHLLPQ